MRAIESIADRFDVIASRAFASLTDFVAATEHLLRGIGDVDGDERQDDRTTSSPTLAEGLTFHVEPLVVPGLVRRALLDMDRTREQKRAHAHE